MSDADLRELERRFRETGGVEEEVAWLRARAHVGDLRQDRLYLAAYLGDPACRIAAPEALGVYAEELGYLGGPLDTTLNGEPAPGGTLGEWARLFPQQPKEVCVRVSYAACRVAISTLEDDAFRTWANEVSAAIEDWLCGTRSREALQALGGYWWSHTRNWPESTTPHAAGVGWALLNAQVLASYDPEGAGDPPESEGPYEEWYSEWAENRVLLGDVLAAVDRALDGAGAAAIEEGVHVDLVPWALGYSDPVHERVEARLREAARE